MKTIKKLICALLCISMLLSISSVVLAADATDASVQEAEAVASETAETAEIPDAEEADTSTQMLLTSYAPVEAYVGDTISAEFIFSNVQEEITETCVYFTINGERLIDYTTPNFTIAENASTTLYWEAKEEFLNQEVVIGFCAEKDGEEICYTERTLSVVPVPEEASYSFGFEFFYLPDTIEVGKVLTAEVACKNYGEEFGATAYFTVNGERVVDYTFPEFMIQNDKRATLYWNATDEYLNKNVTIGFCIEKNGEQIYSITKDVAVVPQNPSANLNFKCSFTYLPEKISPGEVLTAEVTCENFAQNFGATAYFTFNGKRVTDYTFTGFWFRTGRIVNFYWNATEEYLNKNVTIGFCLERQGVLIYKLEQNVAVVPYSQQAKVNAVMAKVNPVNVEATVRYTTATYSDIGLTRKIGTVQAGTKVICISSKSGYSNQVRLPNGSTCCVPLAALNISTKNYTNPVDLTKEEKEIYVNAKGYKSDTNYLIFINIERQKTNVFLRSGNRWVLERSFSCATGTNANPTITGTFKYSSRQKSWNYSTYYVGPILSFYGNYAMHSVLLRYDGSIYDGTVGRPASHGCVRLLPNDINWIANYVPIGTTVVIV